MGWTKPHDYKGLEQERVPTHKPKPDIDLPKGTSDSTVHSELGISGIIKRVHASLDARARRRGDPIV